MQASMLGHLQVVDVVLRHNVEVVNLQDGVITG